MPKALIIDGIRADADPSKTVLEVAQGLGIHIPTLCQHKALTPYGACRICFVETIYKGKSSLHTACTYPAWDGEVKTNSDVVRKARKIILELMLAEAPEAENIQKLAEEYGAEKEKYKINRTGKENLCIMCGLCVRICTDVMKVGAIGFKGRGYKREIATPFDKDSDVCSTCGACISVCPTNAIKIEDLIDRETMPILSDFELGLKKRPVIYKSFPQAIPNKPLLDKENCMYFNNNKACQICKEVCEFKAIDFNQTDTFEEITVGAIIVATGHETFDSSKMINYGYGRYPDVYNALEFERMVNSSGFSDGVIHTADGKIPQRVGIIHCVGSRDQRFFPYCSQICCMFSLKFAHLIRDHIDALVYNFYIDMRCVGKGYEEFYDRILNEGVRFVRGKVAEVIYNPNESSENGKLEVKVEDTLSGMNRHIPLDMIILANGITSRSDSRDIARKIGISIDQNGFFIESHPKLNPIGTQDQCVFIAGTCTGPKDIPHTVVQASAAAAGAIALLEKNTIALEPITAEINDEVCVGCQICINVCHYTAIKFDAERKISMVDESLCRGCGTCVSTCPSMAIEGNHFTDLQIMSEIESLFTKI